MKNFIRGHRQDYFVILLAGILLIIVFTIVFISFSQKSPPQNNQTPPPTSLPSVSPSVASVSQGPIQLNDSAEARLSQKILNRPTLAPGDAQHKNTMLNTILHGYNSGVLYENDTVRIEYVQSADLFMAEIKTTDIIQAKADANNWFLKQGFTQEGICNLPLMFYLNPEIQQALQGKNITFSPLPSQC